jgi:hypothetical protein
MQYIKHNLPYEACADRPGMYIAILYIKYKKVTNVKKQKKKQANLNVHTYIAFNTDKERDLLYDRPILSTANRLQQ